MSARANYFKIGLFVLIACALLVAGVVILGAGALLEKRTTVETYIDQSVQGLDIGSAVRYRGVQIGNVSKIDFAHNLYPVSPTTNIRYVLIRFSCDPASFLTDGGPTAFAKLLNREIQHGLRVRMSAQGVTGAFYLEVDYMDPERNPPLNISWKPDFPYIPSAPSTISRMSDSVESILRKIEKTQFEEVARELVGLLKNVNAEVQDLRIGGLRDEFTRFLESADKQISEAQLGAIGQEARELIADLRTTLQNPEIERLINDAADASSGAKAIVQGNAQPIQSLVKELNEVSNNLNESSRQLRVLLESDQWDQSISHLHSTFQRLDLLVSRQQNNVHAILQNLNQVSIELKELVREARQYPSGFFFSKPPPPEGNTAP